MDSRSSSPVESEYPEMEPHELWGEHKRPSDFVLHYVKLFGEHQGDWEPKSMDELDRCFRMVRENKDKVSVSELETMVRSARTWQLFDHFARDSLGLIPHLMELLRFYCEENWLFDRYYGLLCFQLLTSVMLAGIINNSDEREHAFNEIQKRSGGSSDIALNVAGYGGAMMLGALESYTKHRENLLSTFFVTSSLEGEYVLLPGLGGFHEKDALWLLDELWELRQPFVILCVGMSGMMPGWAVLFTAMWRHIKRNNSTLLLRRLRNLLLRYALTAIEPEFEVVCNIVSVIEEQMPSTTIGYEELPPVDIQDVESMIRIFKLYLESEKHGRPSSDMLCFPFAMVYHNALTTIPDQAHHFLAAVIECIWETLGKADSELALRKRMLEAFDYAVNSIMSMCAVLVQYNRLQKSRRTASAIWTKLLQDVNMLELVGRLCSIAVVSTGEGLLVSHEKFEDLAESIRHFMDGLKEVTQIHELRSLDNLDYTWNRVLRYIDVQLSLYPLGGLIQHRIHVCRSIWFDVGAVFKFEQATCQQHRCMNPRCPDPLADGGAQYACMRCCWVHYCSPRCQSSHWDSTFVSAHYRECMSLNAKH
ncbi:hypothetical protein V565_020770 [Rhizoctonia solani 123E]|uniref:MYND-type domain-containing protein n=1 Tax=Rhizoctonia solani 123E TaxID=1423351 RepID=A0A074S4N0_9AGAM|nr:hypothetical protein V565_020770 [Rhizoctonia solani 123E]